MGLSVILFHVVKMLARATSETDVSVGARTWGLMGTVALILAVLACIGFTYAEFGPHINVSFAAESTSDCENDADCGGSHWTCVHKTAAFGEANNYCDYHD